MNYTDEQTLYSKIIDGKDVRLFRARQEWVFPEYWHVLTIDDKVIIQDTKIFEPQDVNDKVFAFCGIKPRMYYFFDGGFSRIFYEINTKTAIFESGLPLFEAKIRKRQKKLIGVSKLIGKVIIHGLDGFVLYDGKYLEETVYYGNIKTAYKTLRQLLDSH